MVCIQPCCRLLAVRLWLHVLSSQAAPSHLSAIRQIMEAVWKQRTQASTLTSSLGHHGLYKALSRQRMCSAFACQTAALTGPFGSFVQKVLSSSEDNLAACCSSNLLFGATPVVQDGTGGAASGSGSADSVQEAALPWNPRYRQLHFEYLVSLSISAQFSSGQLHVPQAWTWPQACGHACIGNMHMR